MDLNASDRRRVGWKRFWINCYISVMLLWLYFTGWWTQGKFLSVFTCFLFLLFQSGKVKNLNMNVKKKQKWKTVWKCKNYLRFHNGSEKLIKSSLKTHENDTITRIFSRKFENISSNWFHNFFFGLDLLNFFGLLWVFGPHRLIQ